MKKIVLKEIELSYFKGIISKKIEFSPQKNVIYGDNGTFKTSLFDGFLWVFFGKDSQGKKDFPIKTIGHEDKDHRVAIKCLIDEEEYVFEKILREKWVKKRGELESVFEGNETIQSINGIVYKSNEYSKFISEHVTEDLFKIVTSGSSFMELHWEKRRQILYSMIPELKDSEVATTEDFKKLIEFLKEKPVETYQKELKQRILATKKELADIPARINELKMQLPETETSFTMLEAELISLQNIQDLNKKNIKVREEIEKQINFEREKHNERYNKNLEFAREKEKEKQGLISQANEFDKEIIRLSNEVSTLRNNYSSKFASLYAPGCCPITKETCSVKGVYEDESSFNERKATELKGIQERGKTLNAQIESLEQQRDELMSNSLKVEVPSVEYVAYDDTKLRSTMPELRLNNERIGEIQALLGKRDIIESIKTRITEIEEQEKTISKNIASLERSEFVVDNFLKRKSEIAVEKINSMFKYVSFELYEKQINGSEIPCCKAFVDGIPYDGALNTAKRINVGIDIVNALSDYHKIYCPVFLDNMESCTQSIDCVSQSIRLVVKEGVKEI